MIELEHTKYQLDRFTINCQELKVATSDKSIKLPVKVFELLKLFIFSADGSVNRNQAIEIIWDGNEGVGERGFTNAMWQLRKAFNDLGAENEEVFKTLHKVGYLLNIKPEPIISDIVQEQQPTNHRRKIPTKAIHRISITFVVALLVIISVLIYKLQNKETIYKIVDRGVKQETELVGIEDQPAISHNDRYLVFRWQEDNSRSQLYIQDLHDNDKPIHKLTTGIAKKSSPAWSLDDNTIAFLLLTQQGECQVRTKQIFTEKIKILDTGCHYDHQRTGLSWSKDGNFLIYPKMVNGEAQLFRLRLSSKKAERPARAKQISFAGSKENDLMGVYSADNKQLIFVRVKDKVASLMSATINSKEGYKDTVLVENIDDILGIDWHYKSNSIFVTAFNNGVNSVLAYDLNEHQLEPIDTLDSASSLSISQITERIYYSRNLNHNYISQISLLKDDRELLRVKSIYRNYFGRYVPKNGNVIFNSTRSGVIDLWHKSPRGKKNLTNGIGRVLISSVSPKSDRYVVSIKSNQTNKYQLYIGEFSNDELSLLDTGDLVPKHPTWSVSGNAIYFSSKSKQGSGIFRINLDTMSIKQVTYEHEIYALHVSEDTLYTSKEGSNGIWKFDLESKTDQRVIDSLQQQDFGNFFWENNSIYFLYRGKEHDELQKYDVNYQTLETIATYPAGNIQERFGISNADEQSFIMTRNREFDANIYSANLN